MSAAGWSPVGVDGTHQYATAALSVFWPDEEFRILVARWPHLTAHLGVTWDEHRRRVERHCALLEQEGLRVQQLPGDVSGFVTFLAARKVKKPGGDDLNAYPDLRTVTIPMTAWPPARTAPCWCGSGRKYKQCCRPHGLGTLDFDTWIDDIAAMLKRRRRPVNSAKELSQGKRQDPRHLEHSA